MRKLIIALVVLAILFVVVDRITVIAAEREVGHRLQLAADLDERPKVTIHGFPFLTQALRGRYDRIDISTHQVSQGELSLENLVVRLRGVRAPLESLLNAQERSSVRARSAHATALLPYEVVEEQLPKGVDVHPQNGRLRFSGDIVVPGRRLPAEGVAEVAVHEGEITVTASEMTVGGRAVGGALRDQFTLSFPVDDMPLGLRLSGVRVASHGLRIAARGTGLALGSSL